MIRRCQLNISYSNTGKLSILDEIFEESKSVIQQFIDTLWSRSTKSIKYVDFKVDTWFSARLQQCLGKQALGIVKGAKARLSKGRKTFKPVITNDVIELDSRFIDFLKTENSFDLWFKLNSVGDRVKLLLPSKKHKHFNNFVTEGWLLKKSVRLRKTKGNYYLDVFFEKEKKELRKTGDSIGLDIGYKKLVVTSDGQFIGVDFPTKSTKISRKKQKSKGFYRALTERDNFVNECVNKLDLSNVSTLVVEDLKHVKRGKGKGKKRKIRKSFMNKLQRWTYSVLLNRLGLRCEREGVLLVRINPAYTSQTCSKCKNKDKKSRRGEVFKCTTCGYSADADYNASLNILMKHLDNEPIVR